MKTTSDSLSSCERDINDIKRVVEQACKTVGLPSPYDSILENHYLEILKKYEGEVLCNDRNRSQHIASGKRDFLNKSDASCPLFRALYENYLDYRTYYYFDYPSFANAVLEADQRVELSNLLSQVPGGSIILQTLANVKTRAQPCTFAQCQILKPIMQLALAWGRCRKSLFNEDSKLSRENGATYKLSATELANFQWATGCGPKPHDDSSPRVSERAPTARINLISRPFIP